MRYMQQDIPTPWELHLAECSKNDHAQCKVELIGGDPNCVHPRELFGWWGRYYCRDCGKGFDNINVYSSGVRAYASRIVMKQCEGEA
jgi:hypothetical protein